MSGKRLLWVTAFSVVAGVIETERLRNEIALLVGLSLIVAWMVWETRIWEKFRK